MAILLNRGNEIKKDVILGAKNDLQGLLNKISEFKNKPNNAQNKVFIPENLNFYGQTIDQEVDFSNCIFEENVIFEGTTFNQLIITNSIFNKSANFNNCTFIGEETNFTGTIFNGDTQFQNANFSSKITRFEKTEFNNKTLFIKAYFYNKVNIGATFNDSIRFNEAKLLGDNINFSGSTFNDNVYFQHCEFHHWVKFENTTFNKLVDFYKAQFFAPQQFHLTDFMDRAIFSDATFDKEAQFIHCKVKSESTINFHSTTFNKGLDISRSNFNLCKASFWDIRISGLNEALSSELYKNNFGDNEYLPSVPKKLRESMRFIKNNFYAENNQIEGLEFYKKEMDIYREEIKYPTNKKENTSNPKKMNKYIEIFSKFHPIFQAIISIFTIIVVASPYLLTQSYIWFYILILPFFAGILYIPYTQNKNNINSTIKEGNYIPFILFFTFLIMNIVAIYGINDYKNDFFYILINKLKNFLYELLKNEDILKSIPTFLFVFISFIFLFLFDFRDKVLLFLNKISNNFGTNWMAGVNFTILIGLITLLPIIWLIYFKYNYILYFDPSLNGIGNFLYNFGQIINITEWSDIKIYGEEITGWSYVWLFIGRIFIGYGYYQTIQAFRKYGKS